MPITRVANMPVDYGAFHTPQYRLGGRQRHQGHVWQGGGCPEVVELIQFLRRYLTMDDSNIVLVAGWVVASYMMNNWDRFPILAFVSPVPGSGKTRCLEVMKHIATNPVECMGMTAATVFRLADALHPTLLFDEAQRLDDMGNEARELKSIFCGSISKDQVVYRCNPVTREPKPYSTWCPKAVTVLGSVDTVVADRSFIVPMYKRTSFERGAKFRQRNVEPEAGPIKAGLASWCVGMEPVAKIVYEGLSDSPIDFKNERLSELMEPIYVVLHLAGIDEVHIRDVAQWSKERQQHEVHQNVLLLNAIDEIFLDSGLDLNGFVQSAQLIELLNSRDLEPWATWGDKGKGFTGKSLAGVLKQFEVFPGKSPDEKSRGYYRDKFKEANRRYLYPVLP